MDVAVSVCEVTHVQSRGVGISLGFQRSPLRSRQGRESEREFRESQSGPTWHLQAGFLANRER